MRHANHPAVHRGTDPAFIAGRALLRDRVTLLPAAAVLRRLDASPSAWREFGAHWDELVPDGYAADRGCRRTRRFGHYQFFPAGRQFVRLPHHAFLQPEDSNVLYIGQDRHFDPLTEAFAGDPILSRLLDMLAEVATMLENRDVWHVKVTPFRVFASADVHGQPTPEGRHRDGVTLVTSLLIARRNVVGGASSVFDPDGRTLLSTELAEPGTLLLGDDRCTLHEVTPIRPVDPSAPARRDVLVVTFAGSDV